MSPNIKKMPVRYSDATLEGDFEGWTFTFRSNPPIGVLRGITSGEIGQIIDGLGLLVKSWNFVDEEGEDLGEPNSETIALLPLDLVTEVAEKISNTIGEVSPK